MKIQTNRYNSDNRYRAFADTLNAIYEWGHKEIGKLRWVDDPAETEFLRERFPPRPIISVREDLPSVSVRVSGFDEHGPVGEAYAPLLMRDVRPLMANGGDPILRYPITTVRGRDGARPHYPTLGSMFESYEQDDGYRIRETPLVEAIAFVPIGEKPKGFKTEFAPEMRTNRGSFAFPHIVEDSIGNIALSGPGIRHLTYIGKDGSESLFAVNFVPDMGKFEKWATVGDQTGHMIVIARPVVIERIHDANYDFWKPPSDYSNGTRSSSKDLDFGRVKITQGSTRVGQGRGVNCEPDTNGLIGVYHFRVIGVRSKGEFEDKLGSVEQALSWN